MEYPQRKVKDIEYSKTRGEVIWATERKAIMVELPKPSGAHIAPSHALDAGLEATGFNDVSAEFQPCFGPIDPFCISIPPFMNENIYAVPLYLESIRHLFLFYRGS
jgi:hypothetical protein